MKIQEIDVGGRIRAQRKKRKLSLNQLASMTGIAASNLSSIELNKSSPTLGTLAKIASAFEMKVSAFVEDVFYEKVSLCIPQPRNISGPESGKVILEALTGKLDMNLMDVSAISFDAESSICSEEGSERFIYCIDGNLEVEVGDDLYDLKKKTGLYLMPEIKALIRNRSRNLSIALFVEQKSSV